MHLSPTENYIVSRLLTPTHASLARSRSTALLTEQCHYHSGNATGKVNLEDDKGEKSDILNANSGIAKLNFTRSYAAVLMLKLCFHVFQCVLFTAVFSAHLRDICILYPV